MTSSRAKKCVQIQQPVQIPQRCTYPTTTYTSNNFFCSLQLLQDPTVAYTSNWCQACLHTRASFTLWSFSITQSSNFRKISFDDFWTSAKVHCCMNEHCKSLRKISFCATAVTQGANVVYTHICALLSYKNRS